jgi:hypothetical protein
MLTEERKISYKRDSLEVGVTLNLPILGYQNE